MAIPAKNTPEIHNDTIAEAAAECVITMLDAKGYTAGENPTICPKNAAETAHEMCADYVDQQREGVADIPSILHLTSLTAVYAYQEILGV